MSEKRIEELYSTQIENGDIEVYSDVIGMYGFIQQVKNKNYYVFYTDFKGFLKAKHLIFIISELNRLNNYYKYRDECNKKCNLIKTV
jgi:hypothetical protein